MLSNTRYIYSIVDPKTFEAFWVGASVNPKARHSGCKQQCCKTIRLFNRMPAIVILEICVGDTWIEAEQDWIRRLRKAGAPLQNKAVGGHSATGTRGSLRPKSLETRTKLSVAHKGKTLSDEHKRKISAGLVGHSGAWKGKQLSEDHKRKVAEGVRQARRQQAKLRNEQEAGNGY